MNKSTIKLGEHSYVTKLAGFEHTKYIQHNATKELNEIPLIIGKNIKNGIFDENFHWYISKELSDQLPRSVLDKPCILIPYVGALGELAIFHNNYRCHLGSNVAKVELTDDKFNLHYLYYYLKSNYGQSQLLKGVQGSVQANITMGAIRDTIIKHYPTEVQKKIAKVLSDLDAKIELNNNINAELEAMAKLIYDFWFVQFDFPISAEQAASMGKPQLKGKPYKSSGGKMVWNEELKREVPEGWEVKKMIEVIEVKDGTHDSPKPQTEGYHLITSKNLKNEGLDFVNANLISELDYINVNKRSKVETGDILFSMIGNIGTIYKVEEKEINFAIKNVALYKTSQTEKYKNFIYMFLKSMDMDRYMKNVISGSIQKFIGLSSIRNCPIFVNDEVVKKFNQRTFSIFLMLEKNKIENQKLAELRDWLLPMLMNGQVRIDKLN